MGKFFGFGSGPRFRTNKEVTPGPGDYDPQLQSNSNALSFGKASKPPERTPSKGNGTAPLLHEYGQHTPTRKTPSRATSGRSTPLKTRSQTNSALASPRSTVATAGGTPVRQHSHAAQSHAVDSTTLAAKLATTKAAADPSTPSGTIATAPTPFRAHAQHNTQGSLGEHTAQQAHAAQQALARSVHADMEHEPHAAVQQQQKSAQQQQQQSAQQRQQGDAMQGASGGGARMHGGSGMGMGTCGGDAATPTQAAAARPAVPALQLSRLQRSLSQSTPPQPQQHVPTPLSARGQRTTTTIQAMSLPRIQIARHASHTTPPGAGERTPRSPSHRAGPGMLSPRLSARLVDPSYTPRGGAGLQESCASPVARLLSRTQDRLALAHELLLKEDMPSPPVLTGGVGGGVEHGGAVGGVQGTPPEAVQVAAQDTAQHAQQALKAKDAALQRLAGELASVEAARKKLEQQVQRLEGEKMMMQQQQQQQEQQQQQQQHRVAVDVEVQVDMSSQPQQHMHPVVSYALGSPQVTTVDSGVLAAVGVREMSTQAAVGADAVNQEHTSVQTMQVMTAAMVNTAVNTLPVMTAAMVNTAVNTLPVDTPPVVEAGVQAVVGVDVGHVGVQAVVGGPVLEAGMQTEGPAEDARVLELQAALQAAHQQHDARETELQAALQAAQQQMEIMQQQQPKDLSADLANAKRLIASLTTVNKQLQAQLDSSRARMSTAAALQQQVANLQESLVAIEQQRDALQGRLEEETHRALDAAKLQKQLEEALRKLDEYEQEHMGRTGVAQHTGVGVVLNMQIRGEHTQQGVGRQQPQEEGKQGEGILRPAWADALIAELRAHARFQRLFVQAEQGVVVGGAV